MKYLDLLNSKLDPKVNGEKTNERINRRKASEFRSKLDHLNVKKDDLEANIEDLMESPELTPDALLTLLEEQAKNNKRIELLTNAINELF